MDYSYLMLEEFQRLEEFSPEYNAELRLLSKRIRRDFWTKENEKKLSQLLRTINKTYKMVLDIIDYFDIGFIYEYINLLAQYCIQICPNLNAEYYNRLVDDIQMENARVIIEGNGRILQHQKMG